MFKIYPKYSNFKFLDGDLNSFEEDFNSVFVLMPFGDNEEDRKNFSELFQVMKDTIEKGCFRGGKLTFSRSDLENGLIIMDDISKKIKKAGLTIFDISKPNLNVYFELGIACTLDKKILLTFNPTYYYNLNPKEKLPFDINQFRYIEYRSNEELKQKLKPQIESIIKVETSSLISIQQIYGKLQKLTRHFDLDSKAEQVKEDFNISDYEIEVTCNVLNEYWDNRELEKNEYKDVDYMDIEMKIRHKLSTNDWNRVKFILIHIYWDGYYQQLLANMESPLEFLGIKRDYESQRIIEKQK
ncbi:MAG: hypothetical protein QQN55_07690 [Nitrosopumilus sp.]